jgi:DNA-binding beta-propeller fold protein YncE
MKYLQLALAASMMLVGCGSEASGTGGTGGTVRACATDIAVGEVQAFGPPMLFRTEGITFDATGRLFVSALDDAPSSNDQLLEIMTDGSSEPVAEADSLLGIASDARGIVAASIDTGELLLIHPDTGANEVIASGLGKPNFVAITPWDTILVSDDTRGENTIHEVTWEGAVSTWVQGVPTPNGMVFSLDAGTLYVASTFEEIGLWRVPVDESGAAGTPDKWVTFPPATTPDGVAIDSEGNVYVALNIAGQIAKVAPDGTFTTLASGVYAAASLAFGQGDFDPCSLYVTSLLGTQLWRVGTGIPGVED